jgi:hypothetical protein
MEAIGGGGLDRQLTSAIAPKTRTLILFRDVTEPNLPEHRPGSKPTPGPSAPVGASTELAVIVDHELSIWQLSSWGFAPSNASDLNASDSSLPHSPSANRASRGGD